MGWNVLTFERSNVKTFQPANLLTFLIMPNIIGIRFQRVGKIYHFDASVITDLRPGDYVVVETSRGRQLGEVVHFVEDPPRPPEGTWKPVQRKATPQDLVQRQIWKGREAEALVNCREKVKELNLPGVKVFAAEYSFEGSRLSFLYSLEEGEKVDFTALRRALLRLYPHVNLDLHQIGPRDVAKMLGGIGACGLSNRCCSMFITDFSPVSIKMAKEQGISLTPTEITGMCGRLRCCLVYEYEQYVEARKHLPKRNKRVITPKGEGRVLDVIPLSDSVIVELDETGVRQTYRRDEIEPWDELSALRRKAEQSCAKHPEGGCNCRQQAASQEEEIVADDEELGYTGEAVSLQSAMPPPRPVAPAPREPVPPPAPSDRSRPPRRDKSRSRPKQSVPAPGPSPAQSQSKAGPQSGVASPSGAASSSAKQQPGKKQHQQQRSQQRQKPGGEQPQRPPRPPKKPNPPKNKSGSEKPTT
jgi:cell fate regulator YaaT (PSP1 superfamily)